MANVIEYEGKEYRLIDNAEISQYARIQIEDSICYLTGIIYEAPCIDKEWNLYTAYWLADENAEMPEDACNWEKPVYIKREF